MESLEIPLDIYSQIPEALIETNSHDIRSVFPHPSLIFAKGEKEKALVIATCLHGNEHTSYRVLQKLARLSLSGKLSRSLIIIVGNVYAVEQNKRFLSGQEDYNRIWLGGKKPEHILAERILERIRSYDNDLYASIDIHNNTGKNPTYACFSKKQKEHVYLASLFSNTNVYFEKPNNTLSVVMSNFLPSVTIECGKSEEPTGIEKAFQYVLDVMRSESLDHHVKQGDMQCFHTQAKLNVKKGVSFSFRQEPADVQFIEGFENLNFTNLSKGSLIATTNNESLPLQVIDDAGIDRSGDYFHLVEGKILLKKTVYPSMFTTCVEVIRQDCLGYLMAEMPLK